MDLTRHIVEIARLAGEKILEVYNDPSETFVGYKNENSPVTKADLLSNSIILAALEKITPKLPVITEESSLVPYSTRSLYKKYWLIDPLDGTKEFLKKNDEFTVNIALIEDGKPQFGVVHAPAINRTFFGGKKIGAWKDEGGGPEPITVNTSPPKILKIVASKHHSGRTLELFLSRIGEHSLISMGSSLKFCLVADGTADIYPRFSPTMEWDTAAAQAVVEGAGGMVQDLSGQTLSYNRKEMLNSSFIVTGSDQIHWQAWIKE